jgi:L-glutamine:2-deoxy-scyllo-inosose/3-amino-2,3-dideoxy-scyllo-inosose aminotransferase
MSKLALLGGQPVLGQSLDWRAVWPPVDEQTCVKLQELYYSRKWTAFDETEGVFTRAFAAHHGAEHGVFMINGTVTLQCALRAYGIGPGDEVIVPALTWCATIMAVHYIGATPVIVDIDRESLCIDPKAVEAAISPRTRAIIPVHLYGATAQMDLIMEIARRHGLRVIEDCAHVHGGVWDGKGIGTIGDVGSFSFQHAKGMGSAEGGICITNDANIAERIFRMSHIGYAPNQAQGKATSGPPPGLLCYPFRATAFQALILHQQLQTLNARLERYQRGVKYLEARLGASTRIRFQRRGDKTNRQGYYGWVMLFDDAHYSDVPIEIIQKAIEAEGVPLIPTWGMGPVYRFILFNLKPEAYRVAGDCPVTELMTKRLLWLHHPFLGFEQDRLECIADAIEKVLNNIDELRNFGK